MPFGTVPILWNNDDVPELTPAVPFERVLDEIREAGFAATELGSNYPRDARMLRDALKERDLALSGAYFCPGLTDPGKADEALDAVEPLLELLEAVGCEYLIAAEPLNPAREAVAGRVAALVRNQRKARGQAPGSAGVPPAPSAIASGSRQDAGAPRRPEDGSLSRDGLLSEASLLSEDGWRCLARSLDELGWRCKGRGIRLAFHNHAGTWVETPDELDKLIGLTSPERVGLCLDTGHYLVGGGDPVEAVRKYLPRLAYVHFKDVEPSVLDDLRSEGFGFLEALRRRIFTELGTGWLDALAITRALQDANWSGWVVSEQDTTFLAPLESASMNHRALERLVERVPQA